MSQESRPYILAKNTAAVVGDAHEGGSAVFDFNGYILSSGVNGVFDQFLNDGSRPFNDFSGGDQFRHMLVEYIDHTHAVTSLSNHIFKFIQ